ncbi:MAG: hypothetical protein WC242_01815 [Candidatus Paceibacterota bacterium]|jgi:hypothetical protein
MSREIVQAGLTGFVGPIEHSLLDALNNAWDNRTSRDEDGLKNTLSKKIQSFVGPLFRIATSDGYKWFWAANFKIGAGKLVLLFPWSQDWKKKDRSQMDRSIGIYTEGEVDDDALNTVLVQIIRALERPTR